MTSLWDEKFWDNMSLKIKSFNWLVLVKMPTKLLQKEPVDVLFLDIQMPGMSGMALMKSLENPPFVVFTTAYDQYAVEGYEVSAVDYLLKP
ncbi:MAG: response regulator, partial [Bacteroidales bacterium]|nr:response regulator [Bacteroidales bacterium]